MGRIDAPAPSRRAGPKTLKIILVIIGVAYILFPRDLVPDRLGRGFGYIDDLLVVLLLTYVFRRFKRRQAGGGAGRAPSGRSRPNPNPNPNPNPPRSRASANPPRAKSSRPASDPYTVLGISPSATQEEIRKAYRARMVEYHPDRVNHLGEELREVAHQKTLEIQRAYAQLKR